MPRRLNPKPMALPPAFAALQAAQFALDLANRRVKELELVCGTLDDRLNRSDPRADAAELALWQSGMLDEAGQVALNDPARQLKERRESAAHRRAH